MIDGLMLPHCAKGVATSNAAGLRIREKPETGKIIGSIGLNETVTIWAVENDWAIVQKQDGTTGWASLLYMSVGELTP